MEISTKNIIAVLLVLLATQMMLFIVLNFIPSISKNDFSIKKINIVPELAPSALSGKWKLIK